MRSDGRGRRVVRWYIAVALTLTAFGGILHWLVAPPIGLVRTVYADIGIAGEPLFEVRTTDISLAFLDEDPTLPRRFFSVEWRGFWFLPRAQTVDVYAGGDDRVDVLVDDQLVLRRNFSVGTHTTSETITLGAGSHEIIVRYEQEGGSASLNIQRAIDGKSQRTFLPTRLFSVRPNVQGFLLAAGSYWLTRLVAVLWLGPIAWLFLVALGRAGRPVVHRWRTVGAPRTAGDFWRRLQLLAGPTLLGPFVLFLLGPYTSYGANRSEFNTVFSDIAWPWLAMAVGGGWAILLGIGCVICLLSDRLTRLYAALVFAVGVLLWVQGTILVADYGLLLGEGLDLSRHVWRAPYEIALWLVGIGLAAVFARRVSAVAPFGSQLLIALQLIVLVLPLPAAEREARVDAPAWSLPPDEIYQLSRDQNVIHVVLDGFLSDTFAQFIEEERSTFDRDFSGFIFFADHLGAFPTTKASMPAMLTGIAYRNEMPIDSFISANIRDRSIFRMLAEQGYQINAVSFIGYDHPPASFPNGQDTVRYTIPTPYGSYRDYVQFAAVQLLDMSLFRHVPHGFKSRIYDDQAWLLQGWYSERQQGRNAEASNHAAFLEEFAGRMTIARDDPVYTFIHVSIPHPPYVLDAECSFMGPAGTTRASYAGQARCGLVVVQGVLERLRSLGVYDRSAIVLTSDHGWDELWPDHPLRGVATPAGDLADVGVRAMALMAVKPAGATGPVRTSYAPTAITDVPATILDLASVENARLSGQSALEIDPNVSRRRTYADHDWRQGSWSRPYLDLLHVFSVDGRIADPTAWSYQAAIFEPASDVSAQLEQHLEGLHPVEHGTDGSYQWGDPHIVTYLPPSARVFSVAAQKSPQAPFPQTAAVRIDGHVVGRYEFTDSQWHTLRYEFEARSDGGNPFCVEILVDPPWHDDSGRRLGLRYRDPPWVR